MTEMNWYRVIAALQKQSKDQLEEAKAHANEGRVELGGVGLTTASVLLGIADALREGLRDHWENSPKKNFQKNPPNQERMENT